MSKKNILDPEKDRELRKRFKITKAKDKTFKIIGILMALLSIFMFYKGNGFTGSILLIVGLIGCLLASLKNKSHFKTALSVDLIPNAFRNIFDDFDYQPKGCIEKEIIKNTDMGFPFSMSSIDVINGDDFVRGSYNGVDFEVSNIQLQRRDTSDIAEYNDDSLFNGQWISCDFKKSFTVDAVFSKNRPGAVTRSGRIKTDSD